MPRQASGRAAARPDPVGPLVPAGPGSPPTPEPLALGAEAADTPGSASPSGASSLTPRATGGSLSVRPRRWHLLLREACPVPQRTPQRAVGGQGREEPFSVPCLRCVTAGAERGRSQLQCSRGRSHRLRGLARASVVRAPGPSRFAQGVSA